SATIRITRNKDYFKGQRYRSSVQLADGTWFETSWKHHSNSMWDCSSGNYCYAPIDNSSSGHLLQTKVQWKKGQIKTSSKEHSKDSDSVYEYYDCF
ncbi:hypothetical protein BG005_001867, partial [Podila minutissima]